ncbi:hypothetical protein EAD96_16410 [Micromonospora sp. BL1]|uniref:hypothetical protein n=1 Tax=unclassified Micromonospora TaxID=2617518 RepID=UPI000EF56411|nr:hypothetical protein [Micromonospora sp. BL1]RLQ04067.1 hypothetical protein EAD96_16410 [Micromonospora sp. BL1]
MSRWLPLYVRSRRLPAALAGSAVAVAVMAAAWSGFTDRPEVPAGLAVLTTALAVAPLGPTLAGTDPALERTAAWSWPPRRAGHLLAYGAAVVGMLAAARVLGADFGPPAALARNTAGLIGLVGLGAALAGARAAWQVPTAWAALGAFLAVPGGPQWRQAALWMAQEPGNRIAAATAATFLLGGVVAYALRVGPQVAAAEAALEQ